ncbi:MAG: aminopeptidase P family protein [Deltaproteobacteria bacterium]|nr:aminopeptidase P family protein [Deltaproteobacteria bacterium]
MVQEPESIEREPEKVPEEEIGKRIRHFQSILVNLDLDGAFILQNVDIYYFAGTIQRSVLFIPAEGLPLLMVTKSLARARGESPIEAIVPLGRREDIRALMEDHSHRRLQSLGMELDVLPAAQYLWYRETFPETRWQDISHQIRALRMIKSPYEVEQIKKAAAILDRGFGEIRTWIRPGMTEMEIDGWLAYVARREGHMGFLRMRGWNQEMTYAHVLSGPSGAVVSYNDTPAGGMGNTPAMAQGAGFRRVRRNEPICIDYGAAVNGYLGDQTRTFVIGKLSGALERAHECSREIHLLVAAEAKPGTSCSSLFRLAEDHAEQSGLKEFFMGHGEGKVRFVGHGIGLEIDEYPILTPSFSDTLQEGMVFALEPKFIFPGEGIVGLEDDYLVTSSGNERLTLTAQELLVIS